MEAIDRGRSVIVAAPTGAGKTLVADYAVHRALAAGGRAVYTTPLKALSNQKHRDLAARFGHERVGLLTGDRAINPTAPLVVMTTEVLRALLYDRAALTADLGVIVLDEFHYLQDPERGPVWEEVVIEAPPRARLVCLSATVADVDVLARWIESVHGPTEVVVEDARPVALDFVYAIGHLHKAPPLLLPMFVDGKLNPIVELRDGVRRETRGEGLRVRDRDRPAAPELADLLAVLAHDNLLPCIWFVLSRSGCDRALEACVADGLRLTNVEEAAALRSLTDEAALYLTPSERRALGWAVWSTALESGLATHHGGLTPLQRELVEMAYAAHLVKVAFATETLALGVNLPARTVVVDRVTRPEGGDGHTTMSSSEFAQLAGRAGRRGIDPAGHVIVQWSPHVGFHQVAALVGGRTASLTSHFRVTPSMAANLVHRHDIGGARNRYHASLAQHLSNAEATVVRRELSDVRAALTDGHLDTREPPTTAVTDSVPPQRGHAVDHVAVGDVVVDAARPGHGPVAVMELGRARGGGTALHAVRSDGRRVVLRSRDFRSPPLVVARLDLDGVPSGRGQARRIADMVARLDVVMPAPPRRTASVTPIRHQDRGLLQRQADDLEARLTQLDRGLDMEFDAVVRVLRGRGHLDGWTLTASGAMLRRIFHVRGLLVTECIARGLLTGLAAPGIAALTSVFLDERRAADLPLGSMPTPDLQIRWDAVAALAVDLAHVERDTGLAPTPAPTAAWARAVRSWASGAYLDDAVSAGGLLAGDLIRAVKQVADLLEQIANAAPDLAPTARTAIEKLLRGAVVAGAPTPSRN